MDLPMKNGDFPSYVKLPEYMMTVMVPNLLPNFSPDLPEAPPASSRYCCHKPDQENPHAQLASTKLRTFIN